MLRKMMLLPAMLVRRPAPCCRLMTLVPAIADDRPETRDESVTRKRCRRLHLPRPWSGELPVGAVACYFA